MRSALAGRGGVVDRDDQARARRRAGRSITEGREGPAIRALSGGPPERRVRPPARSRCGGNRCATAGREPWVSARSATPAGGAGAVGEPAGSAPRRTGDRNSGLIRDAVRPGPSALPGGSPWGDDSAMPPGPPGRARRAAYAGSGSSLGLAAVGSRPSAVRSSTKYSGTCGPCAPGRCAAAPSRAGRDRNSRSPSTDSTTAAAWPRVDARVVERGVGLSSGTGRRQYGRPSRARLVDHRGGRSADDNRGTPRRGRPVRPLPITSAGPARQAPAGSPGPGGNRSTLALVPSQAASSSPSAPPYDSPYRRSGRRSPPLMSQRRTGTALCPDGAARAERSVAAVIGPPGGRRRRPDRGTRGAQESESCSGADRSRPRMGVGPPSMSWGAYVGGRSEATSPADQVTRRISAAHRRPLQRVASPARPSVSPDPALPLGSA